ncbi:phosphatase PAP2 family protein [Candidatus Microgenomates bacterium]|nr:phosphatase PAP2 family protein [Candidatus Microgenomates bacterium]
MKVLLEIDYGIFLFINNLFSNPLLDNLMLFFSKIGNGAMIWLILGLLLVFLKKKKNLQSMITFLWPLFLSLALSYILVSLFLKPVVGRMRPNFVLSGSRILGSVLDDFSFPSGHAASSFAAAFVLGKIKKQARLFFYLLALLISFSRIYIGVHYPLDVLVGVILGVIIGKASVLIDKKI